MGIWVKTPEGKKYFKDHSSIIMHDIDEKQPKLGSGARFKSLKKKLAAQGATDPGALAAYIGRKRYGKKKFQKLAAQGKNV